MKVIPVQGSCLLTTMLEQVLPSPMKIPRTAEQKAQERETARLRRQEKTDQERKLQGPGSGFSHQVPSRGVPSEIQEMARMVDRFGGYYGEVSEAAVNAFRRRLREARI